MTADPESRPSSSEGAPGFPLHEKETEKEPIKVEKEENLEDNKNNGESREELVKATPESGEDGLEEGETSSAPPLPDEVPPPLPNEALPDQAEDDGWEPVWDADTQAYYFYNRFTGVSQWENPRVPSATAAPNGDTGGEANAEVPHKKSPVVGGYNPAIHGDYDPTAPYAQQYEQQHQDAYGASAPGVDPAVAYAATGAFNRFTGKWQAGYLTPENYNDENKARRQMRAFFDVDAAANSHDGRSLKAERSAKKLSRKELKLFKEKRREKKEEKRRAWLRD